MFPSSMSALGKMSRHSIELVVVIAAWFALNISMGSSTKWLFLYGRVCQKDGECSTFKFPLAITVVHMLASWGMCYVHIFFFRGGLGSSVLTFRQQVEKVSPLACCFALTVAMGNMSLKYIYPSFNQMLGSMSPLVTVLMSVIFQSKRYNYWTWFSMPIICGGLIVCSRKEVNFHMLGALFAGSATFLRSAKSIIQGKLLTEKMDSVTLLFYMAPWSAAFLAVLMILSEGASPILMLITPADGVFNVICLLIVSGFNACLLNVTNFLVTSYTSPVTLQVLGNVKNCMAIGVSVAIFGNDLTFDQLVGVAVCLLGVWIYNKYGKTIKDSEKQLPNLNDVELPKLLGTTDHHTNTGDDFSVKHNRGTKPMFPSASVAV